MLKHLSKFLPLKTLDQIYKSAVRPHYCDIIYHKPLHVNQSPLGMSLNSQMEKVKKIQYPASLAISDCWRDSSRSKLCEELGWETI